MAVSSTFFATIRLFERIGIVPRGLTGGSTARMPPSLRYGPKPVPFLQVQNLWARTSSTSQGRWIRTRRKSNLTLITLVSAISRLYVDAPLAPPLALQSPHPPPPPAHQEV